MKLNLEATRVRLRGATWALGLMFLITGCAGLLAEQCFEKLLSLLLGASTPAAAVVLAVYFLGLSLGSYSYPRIVRRTANPLRIYSFVELGVAAWSIFLLVFNRYLQSAAVPLLRLGVDHFWVLQALRFLVACIWIVPPTFLMGLSFPAVVDALELMRSPQPRKMMSRFYALNILGALGGALMGPYWLFPAGGLAGGLAFTAVLDGMTGGMAWMLAKGTRLRARQAISAPQALGASTPTARDSRTLILLALAWSSGFIAFSLEVLWTHLIGAVLGNSIYAFADMLMMVLAGLTLGGAIAALVLREKRTVSAAAIGTLFMLASLAMALQHTEWPGVSAVFVTWGGGLSTFEQAEFLRLIQAARLILPTATAMGVIYPMLFRMEIFKTGNHAATIGRMGALNALGCVMGALLTGFVLIPSFGSEHTSMGLGLLEALGGVAIVIAFSKGPSRWSVAVVGAAVGLLWVTLAPWNQLALTGGGNVYFRPYQIGPKSKLLMFHEDTLGGITTVVDDGINRILLTNGKFQANDTGEVDAQVGFALVPILYTANQDNALVIGLGSGTSAHVVHDMGFKHIDIAEIAPGIVKAAREYFKHINGNILGQPNVTLHLEDGRNVLELTKQRYDLITMEITSVWYAGVTSLYSTEFYRLAQAHLRPGGVMQQWVQLHHIAPDEIMSILATAHSVFPYVELWVAGGQGILVASDTPLAIHEAPLDRYFGQSLWRTMSQGQTPEARLLQTLAGHVLSTSDIDHLLSAVDPVINTDSNRYLEYTTPCHNITKVPWFAINLKGLLRVSSMSKVNLASDVSDRYRKLVGTITPEFQLGALGLRRRAPAAAPTQIASPEEAPSVADQSATTPHEATAAPMQP